MGVPTFAWGEPHLFGLPDGSHVYGREFDLLPAGTMFAASVILHGLAGLHAVVDARKVARVAAEGPLLIYAIRGTDQSELGLYESDVIKAFRIRQAQDAQG
jgi:hypothetical protein